MWKISYTLWQKMNKLYKVKFRHFFPQPFEPPFPLAPYGAITSRAIMLFVTFHLLPLFQASLIVMVILWLEVIVAQKAEPHNHPHLACCPCVKLGVPGNQQHNLLWQLTSTIPDSWRTESSINAWLCSQVAILSTVLTT